MNVKYHFLVRINNRREVLKSFCIALRKKKTSCQVNYFSNIYVLYIMDKLVLLKEF